MDQLAEKRKKQAAAQARFRAKQKTLGIKRVTTEKERAWQREYVARKREEAKKAGVVLASDAWWKSNPNKHRRRTQRWRDENRERASEISREAQARRRSTPWGVINNRMWTVVHCGVRRGSIRRGVYTRALGYSWRDLRAHLESKFLPGMTWENWGDVWELDHIKPLSTFKYESLDDPLFKEAWRLSNLRPLWREANASKGCKTG